MSTGGFIYAIGAEGSPHVKIGKTVGPVAKRVAMLQTGHPAALKVLAAVSVDQDLSRIEQTIHRFLEADRRRGEWFAIEVDQDQLEALLVRAVEWLADEEARKAAAAERLAAQRPVREGRQQGITFGERVAKERTKRGWTQQELASHAGVRYETINRIGFPIVLEK